MVRAVAGFPCDDMFIDIFPLKQWFLANKRDLPWRQINDPYAIWVSEIMLQQTQVAVVIPYFIHWMTRFPTIHHLAHASLDEVIKAWEGLGYYSRARNLHEGARYLVAHFQGKLPNNEEELQKIKGLGPYTIGAILSFAFHQKKGAVDGNVIRVLARYFGIEEDISKSSTIKAIRQHAEQLLPDEEPWVINEALIELGATICQRKARCGECPLKKTCASLKTGKVQSIPYNSKKIKIESLYRAVAVIQSGSSLLVKRGQKGKIMSDLYEFPYFDVDQTFVAFQELQKKIIDQFNLHVEQKKALQPVSHGFTRYQAYLTPILYSCKIPKEIEGFAWMSQDLLKQLAFSSGHRQILQQLDFF